MAAPVRILAVDDEPRAAELVERVLRRIGRVEKADSGESAWDLVQRQDFDLVISDQRMPGMSGVDLLARVAGRSLHTGRILVTAYTDFAATISAINDGCIHAYLAKPYEPDQLRTAAVSVLELVRRYRAPSEGLLGVSEPMRSLMERIGQVAAARFPVLILGETGTGKELVARQVHARGPRASSPFVPVNCAAFPESLLEAELFGYARGAFTGAERDKPGLFEVADGGTLFLDEIGEMSPAMQSKLLRVLETREVRPIGDREHRSVDVRLVSATHRDLESAVKEGDFRQDLYYRINTVVIEVPPLRERPIDVPLLAQHFASELGPSLPRPVRLDESFLDALREFEFPGNVRELRNLVERAIALSAPAEVVTAEHLESLTRAERRIRRRQLGTLRDRVEQVEREAVSEALARFAGNRTQAAGYLGITRPGLTKMMRRLGIAETTRR